MFTNRTIYWIAVDIANQMGYDKLKFRERVAIVENNIQRLRKFNTDINNTKFIESVFIPLMQEDIFSRIESKWEFRNAVNALFEVIDTGYTAHMVYLDASNQALQLYAIVTGDLQTAKTCNLANNDDMVDAYRMLADQINNKLDTTFTRSDCKKALMTTMYGKYQPYKQILVARYPQMETPLERAEAFTAEFGLYIKDLEKAFDDALITIAPKAVSAMTTLLELNNESIGTYNWTLPDGFNVKYDVKSDQQINFQEVSDAGFKINLSFLAEVYKADEGNRGMSPNIIHSIDGYVAREMIRRMNGKFITTIHDAFACHPADCDLLIQNYRDILCELLDSTILSDIISEVINTKTTFQKNTDLTCEHIQNSTYLLS